MKAIVTKYLPCTDTKGSRIKASDEDGNSVIIGFPHELSWSNGENHAKAAIALCRKMGWKGELIRGCLRKTWVHVFVAGDIVDVDVGVSSRK